MMKEIPTFSPERCLELMLRYQQTREDGVFHTLIAQYDRLLLLFIFSLLKHHFYLRSVPRQDLYHTSIIGLHRAILKIPETVELKLIIYWIRSYVRAEIFKVYRHLKVEYAQVVPISSVEDEVAAYSCRTSRLAVRDASLLEWCENLTVSGYLTKLEGHLIERLFLDGVKYKAIAKELNMQEVYLRKIIWSVRKKLRLIFCDDFDGLVGGTDVQKTSNDSPVKGQ